MKTRIISTFWLLSYLVLGDDGSDDALGNAVWNAEGAYINGLAQLPAIGVQAGVQAGETGFAAGEKVGETGLAAGQAAIDWCNDAQDATTNGAAVEPETDDSAKAAKCLLRTPTPNQAPEEPAIPPGASTPKNNDDSDHASDIELFIQGVPPQPKSSEQDDCDSENSQASSNSDSCRVATPRIVWPSDQQNADQNSKVLTALIETTKNPTDVKVSEDDGGIFFWTAPLTKKETDNLMKTIDGIRAIEDDDDAESNGFSIVSKQHQKRAYNVLTQKRAPNHLAYISRPPPPLGSAADFRYAYPENAGEGIEGYWLDHYGPVTSDDKEFSTHNIIKGNIRALDPAGTIWDLTNTGTPGHVLGSMSAIAGLRFGVAKKGSLMVIQTRPKVSSILDGLRAVRTHLVQRQGAWQEVRGYTVIGLVWSIYHDDGDGEATYNANSEAAKALIGDLINNFQAVVVCPTGNANPQNGLPLSSEMIGWPARWASDSLPIIAVGGIDMETGTSSPWSMTGPAMTVSAPMSGMVHGGDDIGVISISGTCVSTSITMGLIMDFLSRDEVRTRLNLGENQIPNPSLSVARKIRDYLVQKAYVRAPDGVKCVWNGLWPAHPDWRSE